MKNEKISSPKTDLRIFSVFRFHNSSFMRIAVDIGGTFTDLVALDDQGNLHRSKSLTTPEEPVVIVNLRLTAIGAAANRLSLRASFQKDDKGKRV